jgi:N-hydroxyarylamine O-acetyltransferase
MDAERFYKKIVDERRGGFCYELNGLFNELLCHLGFRTRLVSARVADGNGNFTPEYDHAAIIVTIGDEEFLSDVGFGAFTAEPLLLSLDTEQPDKTGVYVIRQLKDDYLEVAKKVSSDWQSEYCFKSVTQNLSDFAERCDFQQDSPDSHFKKGKLCSIMTSEGRKSLTDRSFVVTNGETRTETPITTESEFNDLLKSEFAIEKAKGLYA